MPRAQRTINPLHFEDLEPHRFEDLVRQLAYAYRPWAYLEATGKQGRDGGVDITGVEQATSRVGDPDNALEEDEVELASPADGRRWLISCKRYKVIGPTTMRRIVAETLRDPDDPPYGFVLAAACDVSAEALAVFRTEAIARGVAEAHLWTRSHLEDLLFQPGNDHLLFAYFGISLGAKRQSRLAQVRSQLATKRKLMRAFGIDAIDRPVSGKYALIRDMDDHAYPRREDVPGFADDNCPPWHPVRIEAIEPQGLVVERFEFSGWLKTDGTWDIAPATRELPYLFDPGQWFDDDEYATRAEAQMEALNVIPEGEYRQVRVLSLIPFASILEVDPIGDTWNTGIHVYCRFDGAVGPYAQLRSGSTEHYVAKTDGFADDVALDAANRRDLFGDEADTGEVPLP